MPRISEFDGVVIVMYYDNHQPPHFHARYGGYQALVHINSAIVRQEHYRHVLNDKCYCGLINDSLNCLTIGIAL